MSNEFLGQTIAEKYQIESVMQENGLGGLYRGAHVFMDKPAAIKLLAPAFARDEDTVAQFLTKAKAASNISDPNVLNVTDSGMGSDGTVYIIYESADGRTLREVMAEKGPMDAAEAVSIARQSAAALAAAHSAGVVHGNLSPDSILVAGEVGSARVKVFDFGLADVSDANRPGTTIVDRPAEYMSPEQCSGAVDADDRSDLYSLGVILYEMLAGEVPFSGGKASDIMIKHVEEAPPPLVAFRHDLAPEIEQVILRALAKDPDMRYQSAVEFADDLDRIHFGVPVEAVAAGAAPNNIWKTAFIVLAGISLLAAALIYATSVKQTNPTTALQPDANGQPVQPINPATGVQEDTLSSMTGMSAEIRANSNMAVPPGTMPGGDGYNPWASGTAPPPGGPPTYVGPGGQVITIDPNNPSPFMPGDGGVILVPVPANTNTAAKPTPTPKPSGANANIAAPPQPKTTPETKPTPAKTEKPAADPPKSSKTPETQQSQDAPSLALR